MQYFYIISSRMFLHTRKIVIKKYHFSGPSSSPIYTVRMCSVVHV